MKKLSDLNSNSDQPLDINLSPLIDMVFLLLIFFMVTAVFTRDHAVAVERPDMKTAEQLDEAALVVTLLADGSLQFDGKACTRLQLISRLRRALNVSQEPVTLNADRMVSTGRLVEVADWCREAGAEQLLIAAEVKQ